jgi:predicted AlkP superfamily phosphohydrolase/phosphomutase
MLDLPEKPRLLAIGIDGADYRIIEWLMAQGRLRNLAMLAERGAWGPARSTIPPLTPAAWTTIMTGKNPGKHGVFDFLPMNGDPLDVPIGLRRRATTIWRALSDRGYRVGTFNLPLTYPAEPLSGFQVAGFMAPAYSPAIASPPRALEVLRESGEGYTPLPPPGREERFTERELRDRIDLVPIVSRRLLGAIPCDVFMANFQVVDWVQHSAIASEMRPGDVSSLDPTGLIARTYQLVDERIGIMLRELCSSGTHVMVISDHGTAVVDRVVNLEKLFLDEGLMAYTSASTGHAETIRAGRRRARASLAVWGALKRLLPKAAARLRPFAARLRDQLAEYQDDVRVDWSRTAAAPWGLYGQVRFNVRGRDPEGTVSAEDLSRLRARITELVLRLRDPVSGEPIYDEVRDGREVYSGPYVSDGPDLVCVPRDDRYLTVCGRMFRGSSLPLLDAQSEIVVPLDKPRDFHSARGIFGMAGPGIDPGTRLPPVDLVDFVPTALYLLNQPIPEDMDGYPVLEGMAAATRTSQAVRWGEQWPPPEPPPAGGAYTPEEQRELEEQLVALGYI